MMRDFDMRLELLYQKAFEYRSIVSDPSVAASAKIIAKNGCDELFHRLAYSVRSPGEQGDD